ncbi:MAG: aminoglycoside phosphotransferase family protein [Microcoleus sp. PH2017_10_PVI_O_A]|uniref:aminoglycoside phosphotransferase family protein n=1 Tax=unclassified Microcoleus TaxID=2642155 RepID=UPI001D1A9E3E|nr:MULTISPECIES: aminoglycoside phosphotransferase family protein [unclassified Microcoleus]TAE80563.1 MAG: aminoglycoside phosphotransferase family protein [Oscillatoriales cyanobacterium]MCC3405792.1 aminoglycoside phosphotransferase family protein [Microcoleus sp. PH2017_10_PVI_O_A]MCC3459903.1 aminoglycoside phosphotransferase family protein [Microcoleus sp. PH2017_11_PCY_U_A]MCC3478297.1 aminoglycoside phosphotransferase family protein [Microcoleus sp. PH2017_12_PCY_D_A]MCC3559270.1 amino
MLTDFSLSSETLYAAAVDLMAAAGYCGEISLETLAGGGNNRVFRVAASKASFLLKAYFQHPDDPRDRLGTEFAFSRFAWDNGVRGLPQPIACDSQNNLALYEFVGGRQLQPDEVTEAAVERAIDFYRDLNRCKLLSPARFLPKASEACFSIREHLQCVERRLERLKTVGGATECDRSAADLIRNQLCDVWSRVTELVAGRSSQLGLTPDAEIPQQDKCLSPSDFGFHNAISSKEGELKFIDFEYAGWDDPAKMVCDFFCQPAVPVSGNYYDKFVEKVVSNLSDSEMHRQRMAILLPVYRVKWCCIILNDFLPVGNKRRNFARSADVGESRKVRQLQKAQLVLQDLSQALAT